MRHFKLLCFYWVIEGIFQLDVLSLMKSLLNYPRTEKTWAQVSVSFDLEATLRTL